MSKTTLATSPHERGNTAPMKEKICKFPGCKEHFMGVGAAKYCDEHRKPVYRKVINMIRRDEDEYEMTEVEKGEKSNQIIKHTETIATDTTRTCPCGKEFHVKLYPNIDVYPKFCEEHRNPYRRELLLERLAEEEEDRKALEEIETFEEFEELEDELETFEDFKEIEDCEIEDCEIEVPEIIVINTPVVIKENKIKKATMSQKIINYYKDNPTASAKQAAIDLNLSNINSVSVFVSKNKLRKK